MSSLFCQRETCCGATPISFAISEIRVCELACAARIALPKSTFCDIVVSLIVTFPEVECWPGAVISFCIGPFFMLERYIVPECFVIVAFLLRFFNWSVFRFKLQIERWRSLMIAFVAEHIHPVSLCHRSRSRPSAPYLDRDAVRASRDRRADCYHIHSFLLSL
jgi:hypothetical protein